MEIKTLEIRDRATFIPVIAIKLRSRTEAERYLWSRAGYGITTESQAGYVLLSKISGEENTLSYDPHWENRTMSVAHEYIRTHWYEILNGQVIDVEYILGETNKPKESERESGGRGALRYNRI